MDGSLYSGWVQLAGSFPPTLNREDSLFDLKPNETPECWGQEPTEVGYLRVGMVPVGTTKVIPTKTITTNTYFWFYRRLWKIDGTVVVYGIPDLDNKFLYHDLGKLQFDYTVVAIIPAFDSDLVVITAGYSYIVRNAAGDSPFRWTVEKLHQEVSAIGAGKVVALGGQLYWSNASGVFSSDGKEVKEVTRPIRMTVQNFASADILANYDRRWIIGSNFCIDTDKGTLLDYSTAGFRFTSRALAQNEDHNPMQVDGFAFTFVKETPDIANIDYQYKIEDNEWSNTFSVECTDEPGRHSRVEVQIDEDARTCRKVQMRIVGMSSNLLIKDIQVNVMGYDNSAAGE